MNGGSNVNQSTDNLESVIRIYSEADERRKKS